MHDQASALIAKLRECTRDERGLPLLLGAALLLKIGLWFPVDVISPDSALYITAAHYLEQGRFREAIAVYPLPFFPLLLALGHRLVPNWELAALPLTLLASVLTLIPIYRLSRDLFGARAAFWAGVTFMLSPYLTRYGLYIIRDPLGLLGFAWALYLAHRFLAEDRLLLLLLAVFCTLGAVAIRAEAVFLLPGVGLILAIRAWRHPQRRARMLAALGIWIGVPLALAVGLRWALPAQWLYITQLDYLSEKVAGVFTGGNLERYRAIQRDLKEFQRSKDYLNLGGHNLIALVRIYAPLVYLVGVLESFLRMLYPLYGIPLAIGLKARLDGNRLLPLLTGLAFFLSAYSFLLTENWLSKRYLSLAVICFLPWVGNGCVRILDALRSAGKNRAAVLAVALLTLVPLVETINKHLDPTDPTLRAVGIWLQKQPGLEDARVVSSDNRILIYAERFQDIPRWGETTTQELKAMTTSPRQRIVRIEPSGGNSAAADSQDPALLKTFRGSHVQVQIWGPPELARLWAGKEPPARP